MVFDLFASQDDRSCTGSPGVPGVPGSPGIKGEPVSMKIIVSVFVQVWVQQRLGSHFFLNLNYREYQEKEVSLEYQEIW